MRSLAELLPLIASGCSIDFELPDGTVRVTTVEALHEHYDAACEHFRAKVEQMEAASQKVVYVTAPQAVQPTVSVQPVQDPPSAAPLADLTQFVEFGTESQGGLGKTRTVLLGEWREESEDDDAVPPIVTLTEETLAQAIPVSAILEEKDAAVKEKEEALAQKADLEARVAALETNAEAIRSEALTAFFADPATRTKLLAISGVGEKMADAILAAFNNA